MSGFILAFRFADITTDKMKASSMNAFFVVYYWVFCFFCHAFLFLSCVSFFVDVCHPPKPLPGTGKFSLTFWILVYLRHVENTYLESASTCRILVLNCFRKELWEQKCLPASFASGLLHPFFSNHIDMSIKNQSVMFGVK